MKHLPNILTLSNLFCGCIATILMVKNINYLDIAMVLICLSLVFDFFDGFAARLTGASGELGKQLDSLADMVSFGLFPGVLMVWMLGFSGGTTWEITRSHFFVPGEGTAQIDFLKYLGLLITLFSALRLAKFNIDTEQAYYFKGIPTPANTLFIISLFYIQQKYQLPLLESFWFLLAITIAFSYLLVADIPLMALKFKSFKWKGNELVFSFLAICIVLILFFQIAAIPFIILLYIIISIIFRNKIVFNGVKTT